MAHLIVTISRQLGSGGAYIGQQVAARLGIKYLDREILGEAAAILDEDAAVLEGREERVSSFLENFLSTVSVGAPDTGYIPPPYRVIYDKQMFNVESEIIRRIARRESAVIVGRAGYHVLKGHPALVNVFLHASRKFRLQRVMEIYDVKDADEATGMIDNSDACRKKFVEKMTGDKWADALNFHLCLDTDTAGFPHAVEIIATLAEKIRNETLQT